MGQRDLLCPSDSRDCNQGKPYYYVSALEMLGNVSPMTMTYPDDSLMTSVDLKGSTNSLI